MNTSPFPIRGVIEGFYGLFYTPPERNDLISFISERGYNHYIYGPKNDREHRARWRNPYPKEIMDQFAETVEHAKRVGVEFCYSIGPGVSMNYASEEEFNALTAKLKAFYELGVRTFVILLDDIPSEFRYEEEKQRFKTYGEAHVYVTNKLFNWLKELDESCRLMLCPTHYHGVAPFSDYIHEIGQGLKEGIDIFYTGPEICSSIISAEDTDLFAQAVRRKPIIWDNYPVNDLAMTTEIHLGPIVDRDLKLPQVCQGFIVNTMSQAEASKIPLLTFSDYLNDPECYDPWHSWQKALETVGGESCLDSLRLLSENSLDSCLNYGFRSPLEELTAHALKALQSGAKATESPEVTKLYNYLDSLDEAGYKLKFRMENYALRNNLYPWIEMMESSAWAGRRAILLLQALEKKEDISSILNWFNESYKEVVQHPKQFGNNGLMLLLNYARTKVEEKEGVSS